MGTFGHPPERAAPRDLLLVLVAAFGLAASITFVWLGMRAVMDIGGACADGGPFVPVQPCPAGAPAALTLGMLGLFAFGGLGIYAGVKVGGPWSALPLLAWPALFLSLGWNFLEFGFTAGGEEGLVWGWIVPGVLFVLMGAVPLWVAWLGRSSATPVAARFGLPHERAGSADPRPSLAWDPSDRAAPGPTNRPAPPPEPAMRETVGDPGSDPVERLERLAELRRRGDLTTDEYERFKTALLRDAERRT